MLWISQPLRNTSTLISPQYIKLLVFKYLSLSMSSRVLIIYNENGLFLMLMDVFIRIQTSSDKNFISRGTAVQCAPLLPILSYILYPWIDCCIMQNLQFPVFTQRTYNDPTWWNKYQWSHYLLFQEMSFLQNKWSRNRVSH